MKNKNDWYTAITGFIFIVLVFMSKFILKILWSGCKFVWKNKKNKLIILALIIILASTVFFIIKYNSDDIRQSYCLIPIPLFLIAAGCINIIQKFYYNKYSKIFELINFKDKNGQFPRIIKKINSKKDKKVREILIIKSMIPFSTWIKDKDILEHAFNSKIAIKSTQNRQIIKLIKLGV